MTWRLYVNHYTVTIQRSCRWPAGRRPSPTRAGAAGHRASVASPPTNVHNINLLITLSWNIQVTLCSLSYCKYLSKWIARIIICKLGHLMLSSIINYWPWKLIVLRSCASYNKLNVDDVIISLWFISYLFKYTYRNILERRYEWR